MKNTKELKKKLNLELTYSEIMNIKMSLIRQSKEIKIRNEHDVKYQDSFIKLADLFTFY